VCLTTTKASTTYPSDHLALQLGILWSRSCQRLADALRHRDSGDEGRAVSPCFPALWGGGVVWREWVRTQFPLRKMEIPTTVGHARSVTVDTVSLVIGPRQHDTTCETKDASYSYQTQPRSDWATAGLLARGEVCRAEGAWITPSQLPEALTGTICNMLEAGHDRHSWF
jgi:hypothetical protein